MDSTSIFLGAVGALLVEKAICTVYGMYNRFLENDRKRTEMCTQAIQEINEKVNKALKEHKEFVQKKVDLTKSFTERLCSSGYVTSAGIDEFNSFTEYRLGQTHNKFLNDISREKIMAKETREGITPIDQLPEIIETKIARVSGEEDFKESITV